MVTEIARLAAVTSHPDLNNAGDTFESLAPFPSLNDAGALAFGATLAGGGAGVFTACDGRIARIGTEELESCRSGLINEAGDVFYVATPSGRRLGLYAGAHRIL